MRRASRSTTSAEVELARDVEALLDVEAADLLALGAGLVRDELHAEDLLGELARFGGAALGDLDAAAFAATAGVDLRLDDDDRVLVSSMSFLRCGLGLGDRERRIALGDRNAVARENLLGLVLVDFHRASSRAPEASANDGDDGPRKGASSAF